MKPINSLLLEFPQSQIAASLNNLTCKSLKVDPEFRELFIPHYCTKLRTMCVLPLPCLRKCAMRTRRPIILSLNPMLSIVSLHASNSIQTPVSINFEIHALLHPSLSDLPTHLCLRMSYIVRHAVKIMKQSNRIICQPKAEATQSP